MGKANLLVNFVGRMVNWGFVLGGMLGVVYYLLVFQFTISIYLLYGLLYGSILGILLGGVNGLLVGFLTIVFSQSNIAERKYRFAVLLATSVTTFISSAFIVHSALSFYAVTSSGDNFTVLSLLAAIMATAAADYASQAVSSWYLEQRDSS